MSQEGHSPNKGMGVGATVLRRTAGQIGAQTGWGDDIWISRVRRTLQSQERHAAREGLLPLRPTCPPSRLGPERNRGTGWEPRGSLLLSRCPTSLWANLAPALQESKGGVACGLFTPHTGFPSGFDARKRHNIWK